MKTQVKRRRQFRTDYKRRRELLKSERPRLVFRRTNRYFIVQYVVSSEAQDKIKFGTTSKELLKYGWPREFENSIKSIPAAYLTGILFGKRIQEKKLETPIVDSGMLKTKHKTKFFAFLKGLIDSGIKISCNEEAFPEEERIQGKSLKEDFSSKFKDIKSKIDKK